MEGMKQKRVTADIEFGLETYLGRVRSMKNKENNCDDIPSQVSQVRRDCFGGLGGAELRLVWVPRQRY